MSWDIYGNPLRRGHCEVHPHVHEEYPCSVCMAERRNFNQQQPNYEIERLNYELDQQNDYIKELTLSNQNLTTALQKVSDYNLRLEESQKSFISALAKSDEYITKLENERDALAAENEELKKFCLTVAEVDKIRADAVRDFAEWAFDTCPNIDCMFDDKDDYIARFIQGGENEH